MYNSTQRAGRRAKGTEFTPLGAVVVISVKALEGIGRAEQSRAEQRRAGQSKEPR